MRCFKVAKKIFVVKIKTHILFAVTILSLSPPPNRAVDEIIWTNIVELDRSQMTVWIQPIACWIRKATNMQLEYVIFIAFLLQQCLHKCTSVLHKLAALL
jgi:hypothetical protein